MTVYEGRAWKFGSNISTDEILPGRYLDLRNDEVGRYAMAGLDPSFVERVEDGDIIVAGANFGSGSGRETAPIALQLCGISALVASSFGRIFFRNCINIGLPAITAQSTDTIDDGDTLRINLDTRTVVVVRTGETLEVTNLRGTSLEILQAGGIVAFTKKRLGIHEAQPEA